MVIDKRFNAGRHHGYLLTQNAIREFCTVPKTDCRYSARHRHSRCVIYPRPGHRRIWATAHYCAKKWYARDDRYVFTRLMALNCAIPTPNPKASTREMAKQRTSGYGYWVDYRIYPVRWRPSLRCSLSPRVSHEILP
ncbi:hypothetical protein KCP76_10105 [Salmonella enterica subsp. enterica serovar Weltevreden]|nr:hypothetical protein KCP76_10105 [Salmonella enterica subsp. enterica serovar Weltevreden]